MDIYLTVDEKYLQAVDEYYGGETPKSLQLLNEIIAADPQYAPAYYRRGMICFYYLDDYQQAGYNFKICNELDPQFPDVYYHYMKLLAFLNMEKTLNMIKDKAMLTPGVNHADVCELMAQFAERTKRLPLALRYYEEAYIVANSQKMMDRIEESLKRIEEKKQRKLKYLYSVA